MGVPTGRHRRVPHRDGLDAGQAARHVQRRQRDEPAQRREQRRGHPLRGRVRLAAVDQPVPDARRLGERVPAEQVEHATHRRAVIAGVQPLLSHHFNLTVELPLKAIIRGYSYTVLPNAWYNRKVGISKLRIREMGSRYLFIVLYCFIECHLSRGDYRRLP